MIKIMEYYLCIFTITKGVAEATAKYDIKVGLICIAVGAMGPEVQIAL